MRLSPLYCCFLSLQLGEVVRPSAVRAMFASRSCRCVCVPVSDIIVPFLSLRSSIMIGTALSKTDMRKLVDHMSEMEQPWVSKQHTLLWICYYHLPFLSHPPSLDPTLSNSFFLLLLTFALSPSSPSPLHLFPSLHPSLLSPSLPALSSW